MPKEAVAKARNPEDKDKDEAPKSVPPPLSVAPFLNQQQRDLLRVEYGDKFSRHQLDFFFEVVERQKLDPFLREIWPVTRQAKDEEGKYQPRLIILTTLQGFRVNADRTNLCDGESPIQWCGRNAEWVDAWLQSEPPSAARASVFRKDRSRAQTAVCNWDAFCVTVYNKKGDAVPNSFWARMGAHMLGKVALAQAYRGAFPQMSGVYLEEEVPDVLDPDSEVAVEAEMTRKAIKEKEYWDKERAEGHPPTAEQPPEPEVTSPLIAPPPPESEPGDIEFHSKIRVMNAENPRADWRTFPIARIKSLAGRSVGTLTLGELSALEPWLERVKETWGSLDNDIRAHYTAIQQRIQLEEQRGQKSQAAQVQFDLENYEP
jgi:phage recombination protein Bet